MPETILELLETGSLTESQIAEKMGITTEELKACMEYLKQMGYIRSTFINPTNGGCSGNCGSCGSSCHDSTCQSAISPSAYTVWEVI